MKYKKQKGQYGYRDSLRIVLSMEVAFGCAMILIQLLARNVTDDQNVRNILTVMAILSVLPTANVASPLIASLRYRTPPEAFYQKAATYEDEFTVLYDLVITSKDFIMPMDAIAVYHGGVYAYCTSASSRFDITRAEHFFAEMFHGHKMELPVKIIKEERTFFDRLDTLKPVPDSTDDDSVLNVVNLLKNLSM